jgi:hypothetical protein
MIQRAARQCDARSHHTSYGTTLKSGFHPLGEYPKYRAISTTSNPKGQSSSWEADSPQTRNSPALTELLCSRNRHREHPEPREKLCIVRGEEMETNTHWMLPIRQLPHGRPAKIGFPVCSYRDLDMLTLTLINTTVLTHDSAHILIRIDRGIHVVKFRLRF